MTSIAIDRKEEIIMRLVHYLVTKENYTPIVVNGVKNEVWLENSEGPYKIVRINSNYIHNKEQYRLDLYKIKNIARQIKKKTMSLKVNVLNINLDLNEDLKLSPDKNIDTVVISDSKDIKNNEVLLTAFPNIENNLIKTNNSVDLIINVTNDINLKTAKENAQYEATFKPKKVIITYILIAICVLCYIAQIINPNLIYIFCNFGPAIKNGEIYRLITCAFLHASLWHLLCNMYALYIIGKQVENYIGRWKFLFIYLISAITGSLLSSCLSSNISVGASGAIFGLLGSLLYFGYHYRLYLGSVIKQQIIPIILINLLFGLMIPNIDNAAHIGGLIGGYLATMAVGIKFKSKKSDQINGIIVLILYILFMGYMVMFR